MDSGQIEVDNLGPSRQVCRRRVHFWRACRKTAFSCSVLNAVILKKVCRLLRQRDGSSDAPTAEGLQLMTALTVETLFAKKSTPEDAGTAGRSPALTVTASAGSSTPLTRAAMEDLQTMIYDVCRVMLDKCQAVTLNFHIAVLGVYKLRLCAQVVE